MLEKHARKGRLVYVAGKLRAASGARRARTPTATPTEILLVPGGRVQFLDKPNGNPAPATNGEAPAAGNEAVKAADEIDNEIPF